jgi:hypothetical protein
MPINRSKNVRGLGFVVVLLGMNPIAHALPPCHIRDLGAPSVIDPKLDFIHPSGVSSLVPSDHYANYRVTLSSTATGGPVDWGFFQAGPAWAADGWVGAVPDYSLGSNPAAIDIAEPPHAVAIDQYTAIFAGLEFFRNGQYLGTYYITIPQEKWPGGEVYFFGWVTDFEFDRTATLTASPTTLATSPSVGTELRTLRATRGTVFLARH